MGFDRARMEGALEARRRARGPAGRPALPRRRARSRDQARLRLTQPRQVAGIFVLRIHILLGGHLVKKPQTFGELKASGYKSRGVKEELRENLRHALSRGKSPVRGNPRIRAHGAAVALQRRAVEARLPAARPARPGEDAASADARRPARRADPGRSPAASSHDDPFAPITKFGRRVLAEKGDAAPIAWLPRGGALPREARDARRDHRRPDRRHRPDQGGHRASSPTPTRRSSTSASSPAPTAASSPSTSCPTCSRASRWACSTSWRSSDIQIRGFPIRMPLDILHGLLGQPRGLHEPRQHHHAAQGPDRLADHHALPGGRGDRGEDHGAGGVDRPRRRADDRDPRAGSASSSRRSPSPPARREFVDQSSGVSARMRISRSRTWRRNMERRGSAERRGEGLPAALRPAARR